MSVHNYDCNLLPTKIIIATELKDEPHENKPYSRYYSNLNTIYNICKTTSL